MNIKPLSQNAVIFLKYLYAHKGKGDLNSKDAFTELNIEKKLWSRIINELWTRHPHRFIEGQSGISGIVPKIRINQSGIDYINRNFPDMSTIKETCEIIFQSNKERGVILWHQQTYWQFPGNAHEALKLMIREKVLYNEKDGITDATRIEPEIMDANSYEEAKEIIRRKNTHAPAIAIGRDFTGQLVSQSSVRDLTSDRIESTKTTNAIAPKSKSRSSKIIKAIVATVTIITASIAIYEFILKHILKTPSLF